MIVVGLAWSRPAGWTRCCCADRPGERNPDDWPAAVRRRPDNVAMTVTSQRSASTDIVRSAVVALLAVVQIVVAGLGGSGATGRADRGRRPRLPHPAAAPRAGRSRIWAPIYLGFLVYAVYQLLPGQRGREVHRRTGWWLAASAVFNIGVDPRLRGPLTAAGGAADHGAARRAGRGVRPAEPGARRRRASGSRCRGPSRSTPAGSRWPTCSAPPPPASGSGLPGDSALADDRRGGRAAGRGRASSRGSCCPGTAVVGYAAAVVWALAGIALNGPPGRGRGRRRRSPIVVRARRHRRGSPRRAPARAAWG